MTYLDNETEELLHKILENDKNFPAILRTMLETADFGESEKLRSKIKLLIEEGYISKLSWGDNLPLFGRIEQKGRSYFSMKEKFPTDIQSEQKERIFISHSSKDTDFVVKIEQLFELIGINRSNIFCSSIEGQGVKNGKKIEESVRNEIIEDKILIYILSKNFLDSNYCLNELGAGWILSDSRTQSKKLFHIKLSDISFDEIKGFIGSGDKCTECNERSITTFVEEIEEVLNLPSKKATEYRNLVDNFVKDIKAISEASKPAQKEQQLEHLKAQLNNINEAERKIIKAIYTSSTGDYSLDPTSATVAALEQKMIIFTANSYYDYLDPQCSYTFQPWVYKVLKEDNELLKEILG